MKASERRFPLLATSGSTATSLTVWSWGVIGRCARQGDVNASFATFNVANEAFTTSSRRTPPDLVSTKDPERESWSIMSRLGGFVGPGEVTNGAYVTLSVT
ncbi:hypothetical protein SAMN05421504_10966 [Amycolatopsis xylanica]|uniref:Uncharacterized protein n=1 Tax=Amycolatopsis xylanica TaxID=589385 RepID=A0A1H3Q2A6_9PSEU|nr:hypothetical protein SAMN05421504_10966 [Amycolatopsis xylanica]